MAEAEQAFAAFDVVGFEQAMDSAGFALPCLSDPLSPAQAAQYHRLQGLRQFLSSEEQAALASFQSARSADPSYSFPPELVPEGHAILDLYDRAAKPAPSEAAPQPAAGVVYVDGRPNGPLSATGPAVLQVVSDGRVTSAAYLLPGDLLPYEADAPPAVLGAQAPTAPLAPVRSGEPLPRLSEASLQLRKPRFFTGLGVGAVALGSWVLASQAASTYERGDPSWGAPELRRQERWTNGLTIGAGAMSVASVGLMGSAVMVLRW